MKGLKNAVLPRSLSDGSRHVLNDRNLWPLPTMSKDLIKKKLEVLLNFLASMEITEKSHGNWSGTSHTLTIMGVKFSVHFEKHNKVSAEYLYFYGFKGSHFETTEIEKLVGRIPTGYICLEELKVKFPEARITCGHTTCKVHRETGTDKIDLNDTLVGEVPALKLALPEPKEIPYL